MLVTCENCKTEFDKLTHEIKRTNNKNFCSSKCYGEILSKSISFPCEICGIIVTRRLSQIRSLKIFCSKSCAATFNNKLKRKSRRSKCEEMLYQLIVSDFPTLEVLKNDKTMLDGFEVDIAIPSLKLAIEWNGVVHFKPIYGDDKLKRIQKIDETKKILANRLDINLIVVPDLVSSPKFVKEAYLEIKQILRAAES